MASAISAKQLSVTFRGRGRKPDVVALHPLDLELPRGAIVGLLGPNGSGKTTLLRVLAGLMEPTGGSVTVLGEAPTSKAMRQRVAFQPEGTLPMPVLTGREFLAFVGAAIQLPNRVADERADHWLRRLELGGAADRALGGYSTGMQKRLNLAAALLGEPELLLLDEPTSGLDPFGSELVMQVLRERAVAGATVLMASHQLLEVEEICAEVLVMHRGRLCARGTLAELLATGDRTLVFRGLDDAAIGEVTAAVAARGGEVLRVERSREHLFALFRRLAQQGDAASPR